MIELSNLSDSLLSNIKILGSKELEKYINRILPISSMLKPLYNLKPVYRKISVIKDKELKNRPIAVFDY